MSSSHEEQPTPGCRRNHMAREGSAFAAGKPVPRAVTAQLGALKGEVDKIAAQVEMAASKSRPLSHLTDTQARLLQSRRRVHRADKLEHGSSTPSGKLADLATREQIVQLAATVAAQGQVSALAETLKPGARHLKRPAIRKTRAAVRGVLGRCGIVARRQRAAERPGSSTADHVIRRSAQRTRRRPAALDGLGSARTGAPSSPASAGGLRSAASWPLSDQRRQPPPGLLDKLRSGSPAGATPRAFGSPKLLAVMAQPWRRWVWLNHLTLVATASELLSQEGIRPITALQSSTPHLAVDLGRDVPPTRRQSCAKAAARISVLRCAEVVVARAGHSPSSHFLLKHVAPARLIAVFSVCMIARQKQRSGFFGELRFSPVSVEARRGLRF